MLRDMFKYSEKSTFCDYYDLVHYDTDICINECNSR